MKHRKKRHISKTPFGIPVPAEAIPEIWEREKETFIKEVIDQTAEFLATKQDIPALQGKQPESVFTSGPAYRYERPKKTLTKEFVEAFCYAFSEKYFFQCFSRFTREEDPGRYMAARICKAPEFEDYVKRVSFKKAKSAVAERLKQSTIKAEAILRIQKEMTPVWVASSLSRNHYYGRFGNEVYSRLVARQKMTEYFSQQTPENFADFYPAARRVKRHIILHLGPTNSSKTYEAVEDLKRAEYGVYLAPLRLLAYEQYERLTEAGVACSMITGEERIIAKNATDQSSTIEMADLNKPWDVCVIDEGQMLADSQRGGAWTDAILGVCAERIHICASENARERLIAMAEACGDSYEIVEHHRKTPLVMKMEEFRFPEDIRDGDALIVFSRRDVHGVASELRNANIRCSVIYGALPYDVRHSEAKRFATGESRVVVATDAIGMGINLPIRRVVFLQNEKFDGITRRELRTTEIKQIAGRAGRYGIYETGYVQALENPEMIREALDTEDPVIENARINIPRIFFDRDEPVSQILTAWEDVTPSAGFQKADMRQKIMIATDLESIKDDRELIRRFIRFSVDMDDQEVYEVLREFYECLAHDAPPKIEQMLLWYDPSHLEATSKNMKELETYYRVYDFLYAFMIWYDEYNEDMIERILGQKRIISGKLTDILVEGGFAFRKCRVCGRKMAWDHPYGICYRCHKNPERRQRGERRPWRK